MLGKFYYPAIISAADDGLTVTFPDFDFIVTQGLNVQEAFEKAEEVLGMGIDDFIERKETPPKASNLLDIAHEPNTYLSLISIDMDEWTRKYSNKSVRKNVTLPAWLNLLAEKEKVNFSSLLQEALIHKLGLTQHK